MKTLTMRDIASELNLSRASVSYALRPDWQRTGISAATRQRVLQKTAELGYVPHPTARNLSLGKTHTIVLATAESLHHPYMHELVEEIHAELSQHDYHMSLELLHRVRHPESVYGTFVAGRYDGVIAFYATPAELERLVRIRQGGMPVAVIGPAESPNVDIVDYDRTEAARLGVAHLLAQGRRRVVFVLDAVETPVRASRLRGYRAALAHAGVAFDESLLLPWRTDDDAAALWARITALSPRPTAVFSYNDEIAVDLSRAARAAGTRVPAELAIVAQGNTRLARSAEVPLTAVDTDVRGIAVAAVERLLAQINHPGATPLRVLRKPFLVARASSAPAVAGGASQEVTGARRMRAEPGRLFSAAGGVKSEWTDAQKRVPAW